MFDFRVVISGFSMLWLDLESCRGPNSRDSNIDVLLYQCGLPSRGKARTLASLHACSCECLRRRDDARGGSILRTMHSRCGLKVVLLRRLSTTSIFVHHVAAVQRARCRFGLPPATARLASGPCFCPLEWQRVVAATSALGVSRHGPAPRAASRGADSTTPRPWTPAGYACGPG